MKFGQLLKYNMGNIKHSNNMFNQYKFFFFYSLFKVDIQSYVIVISLVTVY